MSSPPRLLVPGVPFAMGEAVPVPEAEARHLRATRLGDGDAVVLLDGAGGRAAARLAEGGRRAVVTALLPPRGEPSRPVSVLLGVGELARVEWAVEKGTECGAARFLLVAAARSQRPHVAAAAARLERLRRIAAEAAKQCDRTVVPAVLPPRHLVPVLAELSGALFVARPGACRLPAAGRGRVDLSVAIGPEGGFDAAEEGLLEAAGGVPFGLGGRVLRLETAVVAALARLVEDEDP